MLRYRNLVFAYLILLISCNVQCQQVSSFGKIIVNTGDNFHLDLNQYITGNNLIFNVSSTTPNITLTEKYNSSQTTILNGVGSPVAFSAPDSKAGTWLNQTWAVVDESSTLWFFQMVNYQFTQVGKTTIVPDSGNSAICNDMSRPTEDVLLVTCNYDGSNYIYSYNLTNFKAINNTQNPSFGSLTPNRFLVNYPPNAELVYDFPDSSDNCRDEILAFNITGGSIDYNSQLNLDSIWFDGYSSDNFCIEAFGIANDSVYLLNSNGLLFRTDDPIHNVHSSLNYEMMVPETPLNMTVVFENYQAMPYQTILVSSANSIFEYDWSNSASPYLRNKYPNTNATISFLDKSASFIYTVTTGSSCQITLFYIGQYEPYLTIPCPFDGQYQLERSTDTLVIVENAENPKVIFYQFSKSYLVIDSPPVNDYTLNLFVNNNPSPISIDINVTESYYYNLLLQISDSDLTLAYTFPGTINIDLTNTFSGPLPIVTGITNSDNCDELSLYSIVDNSQSASDIDGLSYVGQYNNGTMEWVYINSSYNLNSYNCTLGPDTNTCKLFKSYQLPLPPNNSNSSKSDIHELGKGGGGQGLNYVNILANPSFTVVHGLNASNNASVFIVLSKNLQYITNVTLDGVSGSTCLQVDISLNPALPYIYCLTKNNFIIFDLNKMINPSANSYFYDLGTFASSVQFKNSSFALSQKHPTLVVISGGSNLYLLEIFSIIYQYSSPVLSIVPIPSALTQSTIFATGGDSLLVASTSASVAYEYDISNPYNPILIKIANLENTPFNFIASNSQTAPFIILGSGSSDFSEFFVYKTGMPGNSNFFSKITGINSGQTPLQFHTFQVSPTQYYFAMPLASVLGFYYNTVLQLRCSFDESSEYSDLSDFYIQADNELHEGELGLNVTLLVSDALKSVDGLKSSEYSGLQFSAGLNTISFDPRIYFNGFINSFSIDPQVSSDNFKQLDQTEVSNSNPLKSTVGNQLLTMNGNLFIQSANSIFNNQTGSTISLGSNSQCSMMAGSADLNLLVSLCSNSSGISVILTNVVSGKISASALSQSNLTSVSSVQKIRVGGEILFVLTQIKGWGSSILLYNVSSLTQAVYLTQLTGADFGSQSMITYDFDLTYLGLNDKYGIYVADSTYGPRYVFLSTANNQIIVTGNGGVQMPIPSNAVWNGIKIAQQESDNVQEPIYAFISSQNFNTYLVYINPGVSLTIMTSIASISQGETLGICDAYVSDSYANLILTQSNSSGIYTVFYTYSNTSKNNTNQDYPFYTFKAMNPAVTCSSILNVSGTSSVNIYAIGSELTQISTNPIREITIQGIPQSSYLTITGYGFYEDDSSSVTYYLSAKPPSTGGSNTIMVAVIMSCVGVVLLMILWCWWVKRRNNKKRNKRTRQQEESLLSASDGSILMT